MIIDIDNLNSKNDKVFFGEYSGFQRFEEPTFIQATKLEESMRGAFWNPNEISMKDDAVKFHDMPKAVQDTMTSIWFYQTLMDSAQNRGIEDTLVDYVTNPEWESVFKTWGFFEMIHSISYSHIIRGIFGDPSAVFKMNFENTKIINRVRYEIEQYNIDAKQKPENTEEGIKKLLELILMIYALEGIKFYASFLMTYLVHDKFGSIPGATRIIKLINFDEDTHTRASVILLRTLRQDPEFAKVMESSDSNWFTNCAHDTFRRVLDDEKAFADYLIEVGGSELPISREGVIKFLDYYTDVRLQDIEIAPLTNQEKTPLVDWFENYKDLNIENVALQESDLAVYNIGVMVDDL